MSFDTFNKAPGSYIVERNNETPMPAGVTSAVAAMFGVAEWGPVQSRVLVESLADFRRVFGGYLGTNYPAYKQVKKYFLNGGKNLYFTRIVHMNASNPALPDSAAKASGYLYSDTVDAAVISEVTAAAAGNAADVLALSGTYTGAENGQYTFTVTTGGVLNGSTAIVTVTFVPSTGAQQGQELLIGEFSPTTAVGLVIGDGITMTVTDDAADGVVEGNSWTATVTAASKTEADRRLKVYAKYVGVKGNELVIKTLAPSSNVTGEFKLSIEIGGFPVEVFDNLSLDMDASNYAITRVNNGSNWIILEDLETNVGDLDLSKTEYLFGGNSGLTDLDTDDYVGDSDYQTGFTSFESIIQPLNMYCPDADAMSQSDKVTIEKALINWVETKHPWSFAPYVVPAGLTNALKLTFQNTAMAMDASRAATYAVWLIDEDDNEVISPMGAVLGMYARIAAQKGIWYSPAGDAAYLLGFVGVEEDISATNHGKLNENRINVIRVSPGRGIIVDGSRTNSISLVDYKYIGARLNTSDLEARYKLSSTFASQKPNNSKLWNDLKYVLSAINERRYKEGGLSDEDGAPYFVKCDGSINTKETRRNGLVIAEVGLRNHDTSEFVVVYVSQMAND